LQSYPRISLRLKNLGREKRELAIPVFGIRETSSGHRQNGTAALIVPSKRCSFRECKSLPRILHVNLRESIPVSIKD